VSTTISAIVPTYNRADLITETIESLLRQQPMFSEIIVVDDGSTDETSDVLRRFGDHIRVLKTQNRGVQYARNHGAAGATADWLTFCDSDDLLLPGFTAHMRAFIRDYAEYDILYCNFATFTGKQVGPDKFSQAPTSYFSGGRRLGAFVADIPGLYQRLLDFQPLFVSGMTIRRDLFERLHGFDVRLAGVKAEDWEFTLRAVAEGRPALSMTALANVRKHVGNDSSDSMLMALGEAAVLEHALTHHRTAREYAEVIRRSIDARRLGAFDAAFARGEFELCSNLLDQLRNKPRGLTNQLKRAILALPHRARRVVWALTQTQLYR
jgi:glycosyltransferase involved in cell wall biosynthesis